MELRPINFNFSPFDEDVVVIGGKGRGKSTKVKWILQQIQNLPYVVYDYNWIFGGFGQVVHEVNQIVKGQIIYQPRVRSKQDFLNVCNKVFFDSQKGLLNDIVFVVDELHQQYHSKNQTIVELDSIVQTARNYGVSGIYISTRPATIPNTVLSNATHCFSFGLAGHYDIEWLKEYVGGEATLLLQRGKRKDRDPLKNERELTKHSCIYYNFTEPYPQFSICNCNLCNEQRNNFPEVYF